MRPKLLDLFSGAGGAGMGYSRAGFDVTGVDMDPQPRYPFPFIQADALEYAAAHGHEYDVIHASPPCQRYSSITKAAGTSDNYPDLIAPTRELLKRLGKPYVIENVPGAPLDNPLMLCGTMFGLLVVRHRLFETNPTLWWPPQPCQHERKVVKHGRRPDRKKHYAAATGHFSDVEFVREAMGIDWMTATELAQAIPPSYTEFIGKQLRQYVCVKAT